MSHGEQHSLLEKYASPGGQNTRRRPKTTSATASPRLALGDHHSAKYTSAKALHRVHYLGVLGNVFAEYNFTHTRRRKGDRTRPLSDVCQACVGPSPSPLLRHSAKPEHSDVCHVSTKQGLGKGLRRALSSPSATFHREPPRVSPGCRFAECPFRREVPFVGCAFHRVLPTSFAGGSAFRRVSAISANARQMGTWEVTSPRGTLGDVLLSANGCQMVTWEVPSPSATLGKGRFAECRTRRRPLNFSEYFYFFSSNPYILNTICTNISNPSLDHSQHTQNT